MLYFSGKGCSEFPKKVLILIGILNLGVTLRADTLVLWMAGIEAVDAWDEYKREKNRNKSNHDSGVKKNGKSKKETRV